MALKGTHISLKHKKILSITNKNKPWSNSRRLKCQQRKIKLNIRDWFIKMNKLYKPSIKRTKEQKLNLSKKIKLLHQNGHYKVLEKTKQKISKTLIGHKVSQETRNKISKTLLAKNNKKSIEEKQKYKVYQNKVNYFTRRSKKKILDKWNGYCFYSGKYIKNETEKYKPHIEHKITQYDGYINNIPPKIIGSIINIVVCSAYMNFKKNRRSFYDGSLTILKFADGFWKPNLK